MALFIQYNSVTIQQNIQTLPSYFYINGVQNIEIQQNVQKYIINKCWIYLVMHNVVEIETVQLTEYYECNWNKM